MEHIVWSYQLFDVAAINYLVSSWHRDLKNLVNLNAFSCPTTGVFAEYTHIFKMRNRMELGTRQSFCPPCIRKNLELLYK